MTRRTLRRVIGVLAAGVAAELIAGVVGIALLTTGHGAGSASDASAAGPTPQASAAVGHLTQRSGGQRAGVSAAARRAIAIRALLAGRADALLHHNRAAFLSGVDPQSPRFRAAQSSLFANLAGVPLGSWSYALDSARSRTVPAAERARYRAPTWAPEITLSYRLAGFDQRSTTEQQYPTFVQRHGRWYLASLADSAVAHGTDRNLWDFGPVIHLRTGNVLVLGHPGAKPLMREIAAVVRPAIPRVSAVWGTAWPRRVVVLVPRTQRELAAVVDDGSDLAQIAAVATAELAGGGAPAGERVIVSPRNFAKLGSLGRRVVLTHEITHVAARAVTSESTPEWLAEGFADYVGYRGTGVATRFAAAELAADLRSGGRLAHLPTAADFAGNNSHLAEVYEESWLACRLLAHDLGQRGLVAFYRAVSDQGGPPQPALAAALADRLGMTTEQFTGSWRHYVVEQLR